MNENRCLEKLSEDFARLLDGDIKPDIELKSGDIIIKAHQAVLRARSEFFERKLKSAATGDKIELQYIDPAAFQEIIRYMYTAKSPDLSYEVAKKIYKAGEICNTGCLKERCVEFLAENLTLDNACEVLALASEDCFKERVVKFIIDKDIPFLDEYWRPFCDQHPVLSNNVLNKLVRSLVLQLRQRRT